MTTRELSSYGQFVKPLLAARLRAAGLDVNYCRASGDFLFYMENDKEVEVLDLVGGFGAALVGHNHPKIVGRVRDFLDKGRPTHAQASMREATGALGAKLSDLTKHEIGLDCVATFANSGTEAVEAAIKHAELERRLRIDNIIAEMHAQTHRILQGLRDTSLYLPEELFDVAARAFGLVTIASLHELFTRVAQANLNSFERAPAFMAVEGAFHGKTSGSLKLTYRAEYQAPWRGLGAGSAFLPAGDLEALAAYVAANTIVYLALSADEQGAICLVEKRFVNVAACFVEPIQGEGGVHEIDHAYLLALRQAATEGEYPLVMDEIQSGMGRTGLFFASQHSGVVGDYYLLSKALGGSIAKISALLVRRDRYVEEFGYLHTSTFAEDDLSSEIASEVLDLIAADSIAARCADIGDYLLGKLRALQARYPDQVRGVRGRGLMIGIELSTFDDSPSSLLSVLSEQDLLGFMVSGYFLHEERIRVAPTLSSRATIRVEPSAYFSQDQADRFCEALERLLLCLQNHDVFSLTRFVVGRAREPKSINPVVTKSAQSQATVGCARVGFLCHFLEPRDLVHWDRALEAFSSEDCQTFLTRTRGMLSPFVVGRAQLESILGNKVHATIIGVPFTAAQVIESMRTGDGQWGIELINRGVELARRMGCSIVGFGGYTSILTNNCREIIAADLALTSGNSLTAAAALDSAFLAADRLGLEKRVLGVVGAAGNIGRVLAEVAADEVDEIVLVGRKRALRRLHHTAALLYSNVIRQASLANTSGLARSVARTGVLSRIDLSGTPDEVGQRVYLALEAEMGDRAPVRVYDDMSALQMCNLIISATNAARPVIHPEHISETLPVVICDVAVPLDVSPEVSACRPKCVVLRGGIIKAPLGQSVLVDGMSLRAGEIYGCLGETLLMGLAGIGENFSFGALSPQRVRHVRQLARLHGFGVEENPV